MLFSFLFHFLDNPKSNEVQINCNKDYAVYIYLSLYIYYIYIIYIYHIIMLGLNKSDRLETGEK